MKKNILIGMFILILSIGFWVYGLGEGNQQKVMPTKQVSKTVKLPDLTVTLEYKVKKYSTSYGLTPRYVVTNKGSAVARNFKVVLYLLFRSSSKARTQSVWWTANMVKSLGINMSLTFDYDTINTTSWSAKKGGQVGFRVVADHDKQVGETRENNNTAVKWWPIRIRPLRKKL